MNSSDELTAREPRRITLQTNNYVQQADAPEPVHSPVTAMVVADRRPDTSVKCGSCEASFETTTDHALHCWESHPLVPKPAQVRRRPDDE